MRSLFRTIHKGTLALVATAILIGIIWRVEVELRGWEGLKWISYFHWAVPIGAGLFATWLALFANVQSRRKRLQISGLFLLAFIPMYALLYCSLWFASVSGPLALVALFDLGMLIYSLLRLSIFVVYPGILLLFWFTARKFGFRLNRSLYLLSTGFFLGAGPLAILCAFFTGVPADDIHTIKSGNVFPFMTIGLGLPFLAPTVERDERSI